MENFMIQSGTQFVDHIILHRVQYIVGEIQEKIFQED